MLRTTANLFGQQGQGAPRATRSRSIERRPENPEGQSKGYGCALFKDYLILLGSNNEENNYRQDSILCAYNLKEQRPEEVEGVMIPVSLGNSTACFNPRLNAIIFYGTVEARGGGIGHQCFTVGVAINEYREGPLAIRAEPAMPGPGSALSVCHMLEESIYVYDPSPENANFGTLKIHPFRGAYNGWQDFHANTNNIRLNEPSRHALFINDVLYIFAGNVDLPGKTVEAGSSVIEDIYMLDLRKNPMSGAWERTSPSGQVPGLMANTSVAEANGMIYVFGLSEGKSVLWVYNISEQEWKQVRDIDTLTARPGQKAVIYGGQLLIVEWGYSKDSVEIQYFSLDDLNFVASSVNGKEICKDQAENFIQDTKDLFSGKLFPDIVFEVEGEEIPAHKAVIAYRSDYFMKMFTSGMSESHSAKISIPNMKSHIFKAILQYIYCNEVELDEQLALDLIPTVDEYVMKGLKGVCEKYLCKQLRKDNVVDMLIVADRHEIDELKKACFRFILKNLGNIDENEEMMKFSKSLFFELLKFQTLGQQKIEEKSKPKEEEQKPIFGSVPRQVTIQPQDIQLARRIRAERY